MTDNPLPRRIPLAVKLGFTAFMAVLVPYYWTEYGPTNFLYFCDIALFLTLLGVWTERPLFASMAAVGITLPQLAWQIDFLGLLIGAAPLGLVEYMADESISLFARGLSLFHFWLPLLLLWMIHRHGYDRRGLVGWTVLAIPAMLVAYFLLPAPGDALAFPNQPANVNYVYGLSESAPQTLMPAPAWLTMMLIGLPALVYLPTHLALAWWRGGRPAGGDQGSEIGDRESGDDLLRPIPDP